MDEVDKIIIHSLKEIGCKIEMDDDSEILGLHHFTADLLVMAVSKCLQEIQPDAILPKMLPENMAQRFTVATSLAELCAACGYRGDIGYQTFLYPNVIDVRRLFMFLIEQLPKEQPGALCSRQEEDTDDFHRLMKDIRKKITQQLKLPWIPQYCGDIANRKALEYSSLNVEFLPQLNLNIPEIRNTVQIIDEPSIVTYQIPNIFQQISLGDYDLVSSVLHKNSIDLYASAQSLEKVPLSTILPVQHIINSPIKKLIKGCCNEEEMRQESEIISKSPIEKVAYEIESIKLRNDQIMKERQIANIKLNQLRQMLSEVQTKIEYLKRDAKIHERTSVIFENLTENLNKLEGLINKSRERRLALETQWHLHRNANLQEIEQLQKLRKSKNLQSMQELKSTIEQMEKVLMEKTRRHAVLADELKKVTIDVASRKQYTRRIYEFIGNIRKQRNDIYKILDDTKDLQKQLNTVSAQLQRQFNYTDDLLFQSAKHDLHAKKAYKLLASLHTSCNEICDLVSRTGQVTKESRDLEEQIDRERMRNIAESLKKITLDIQKFDVITKTMKKGITHAENEIHSD